MFIHKALMCEEAAVQFPRTVQPCKRALAPILLGVNAMPKSCLQERMLWISRLRCAAEEGQVIPLQGEAAQALLVED